MEYLDDAYILELAEQIPTRYWLHVGTKLGLARTTLESIEDDYRGNNLRQKSEMLFMWRRGTSANGPSKVEMLAQALIDSGCPEVADSLLAHYNMNV